MNQFVFEITARAAARVGSGRAWFLDAAGRIHGAGRSEVWHYWAAADDESYRETGSDPPVQRVWGR